MDEPLSQTQIEAEILRLSGLAEKVTHELASRAREAAIADAAYKRRYAEAFLKAPKGPVADREAQATVDTQLYYRERRMAEALLLSAQEAGRNYRTQLESLRSVNANLRPLVSP
jgi:hypothetical protein